MDSSLRNASRPWFALSMGLFVGCVVGEDCSPVRSIENETDDAGGVWARDAGAVAPARDSGAVDQSADGGTGAPRNDSGDDSGTGLPARDSGTGDGGQGPGGNFTLGISVSGSGTTSPAPGTYTYASGTAVQVAATPASGAAFTGWSGAASGTTNPVTVVMNGDKSLTANFSTPGYTLTITVSGDGSTSPPAGPHTYAPGTSVQVTATPARGAVLTRWSGAASGTTNSVTVTMDKDKTLTANFAADIGTLPSSCPGACDAAAVAYPALSSGGGLGNVTMYSTSASSAGACSYGTTSVMYHAAINVNVKPPDGQGQWQGGKICGQCAEVTALTSQGPKTVVVRIMDKCEDPYCGINLAGAAPAAVMLNGSGRYAGTWRFTSCAGHPEVSDGSPSLFVIEGSSRFWARVRVLNPTAAVESIEWLSGSGSGSLPFATDPENAFEVPINEVLQSSSTSFLITVHYTDGSEATTQLSPTQLATPKSSYPLK